MINGYKLINLDFARIEKKEIDKNFLSIGKGCGRILKASHSIGSRNSRGWEGALTYWLP